MVVRVSRRFSVLTIVVVIACLLAPLGAWARATATGSRLGSHPDGVTRLVIDLSDAIDFSTALYADPYRVVINTPPMGWAPEAGLKRAFGSVSALRFDEDGLGGRIMIDLKDPATVKSAFVIPPRDGQGWRFVMDLQSTTRAAFLAAAMPVRVAAKAEPRDEAKPVARVDSPRAEIPRIGVPEPRPVAEAPAPAMAAAEPAPVPEAPRNIVITSPEAAPPPAPKPAAAPLLQPEPRPQSRIAKSSPVMSAPVPPPLERPAAAPVQSTVQAAVQPVSVPAVAAPSPEPAVVTPAVVTPAVVTKVSAPVPAPLPEPAEPKGLPADGKPVVVIDPGHGGVDPGAIGVSGIYEKYITLAVARELKAALEKNGRYKVYLTRDRDIFIRLRDRIAIARQYNADLFISLHADSVANPQLKGLSVYTLSQNASDSEAQALADKENKADLIAGIDLSHESADVANILIDLAQRETMNRSAGFAGGVVDEVGREANLLGNTHRFAGFAVLKAPDVPSVLIEMGYLSNEAEERNLRQPEHRVKLAKSISRAVDRFFLQGQKARRP
ncbi:MAG: N-acetylmuramoyl-L-alanine amidase [Magnetospirillum sp.]|nr:N-acetylmuramoyl-L-alanine amidase [Magnetospirillum sp.]